MIRRRGSQLWSNVHETVHVQVADLIDIDNSSESGRQELGFSLLNRATEDIDKLIAQARRSGAKLHALGSGWALTDIAATDGWLINTKQLNGCFDLSDRYFEASYPHEKRAYVVLSQSGKSIAELNVHLEVTMPCGFPRSLKTVGIGAGQTLAGAVSGNTHGAAVNFGATPDYVVGIQLVTGQSRALWIERASCPILNQEFARQLNSQLVRDDDHFNAALVSLGAFGVITALAIETDPMYQLSFGNAADLSHEKLFERLNNFQHYNKPGLHHYEFIFNPFAKNALEITGLKTCATPPHESPRPTWIIRSDDGIAPGDAWPALALRLRVLPSVNAAFQFENYRKLCIIENTVATPGQIYTATLTYLRGDTEVAVAVPMTHGMAAFDCLCAAVKRGNYPAIAQVRAVKPTRATLGFTRMTPQTLVFEVGLAANSGAKQFQDSLVEEFTKSSVPFAFHWSKNSGIDPGLMDRMYSRDAIEAWKSARRHIFGGDSLLMELFSNKNLRAANLA